MLKMILVREIIYLKRHTLIKILIISAILFLCSPAWAEEPKVYTDEDLKAYSSTPTEPDTDKRRQELNQWKKQRDKGQAEHESKLSTSWLEFKIAVLGGVIWLLEPHTNHFLFLIPIIVAPFFINMKLVRSRGRGKERVLWMILTLIFSWFITLILLIIRPKKGANQE
jgi:hypothetical protein